MHFKLVNTRASRLSKSKHGEAQMIWVLTKSGGMG
jgi:hypothetical protein